MCAIRAIRAIRIHFTGFRLWYNISAPLPVPHLLRVVAGEALRRFRAAQEHPGPAGDQGQARAVTRLRAASLILPKADVKPKRAKRS